MTTTAKVIKVITATMIATVAFILLLAEFNTSPLIFYFVKTACIVAIYFSGKVLNDAKVFDDDDEI